MGRGAGALDARLDFSVEAGLDVVLFKGNVVLFRGNP
jgi:hypothetical protein